MNGGVSAREGIAPVSGEGSALSGLSRQRANVPLESRVARRLSRSVLTIILGCALAAGIAESPKACTLWSASGQAAGGGTLLAKNRDYSPDSYGRLVLTRPDNGMAYLGYLAQVKGRERLVAGVNEAGLAVVSASASSIPKAERLAPSAVKALLARILTQATSVDEVLSRQDWFAGHSPVMYMLADGRKAAWVEVGADGRMAWREADKDTLAHTNHFLSPDLAGQNVKAGQSSHTRLDRITALLAGQKTFTLEDFERFSSDRNAGPDNSIFRAGSTPHSTRTMARFMVRDLPGQPPEALVAGFEDPARPWRVRLVLDAAFWAQVRKGQTLPLAPRLTP